MKKLFLTLLAILGFALTTAAQTTHSKKIEKTKVVKATDRDRKKSKTTVVLKKDGTPDKRYKTSRKVILKKDGTPDRRFKENK